MCFYCEEKGGLFKRQYELGILGNLVISGHIHKSEECLCIENNYGEEILVYIEYCPRCGQRLRERKNDS